LPFSIAMSNYQRIIMFFHEIIMDSIRMIVG